MVLAVLIFLDSAAFCSRFFLFFLPFPMVFIQNDGSGSGNDGGGDENDGSGNVYTDKKSRRGTHFRRQCPHAPPDICFTFSLLPSSPTMVFENLTALAKLRKKKTSNPALSLPPVPPMSIVLRSTWSLFLRNSCLAFNLRFVLSLFFQTMSLLVGKRKFTLTNLFQLNVHEEALRWGLFTGGFSAQHEFVKAALAHCRGGKQDWINSFVAGASAGPWYLILPEHRREWLTLYAPARAISATWSYLVTRRYISPIDDGSILFILSSSQIMYAYVMRPESLRESYWKFIINAGPLDKDMLGLIKRYAVFEVAMVTHWYCI